MRQDGKTPDAYVSGKYKVHNVHILDASGSMGGAKYDSALAGINEELNVLRSNHIDNVEHTETIIEFDAGGGFGGIRPHAVGQTTSNGDHRTTTHYFLRPLSECKPIVGRGAFGSTPLYATVGETIEKLLATISPEDKVILKVFTDGQENASRGKYAVIRENWSANRLQEGKVSDCPALKELMDRVQENNNFTITFIGTEAETRHMVNFMGLATSNVMAHHNTAASIAGTYKMSNTATALYSKAVSRGASQTELKGDFFKRVADEEDQPVAPVAKKDKEEKKLKNTQ